MGKSVVALQCQLFSKGTVTTVDSFLMVTSVKNGHLELVPAFLYSLYLTLYKMDNFLRRTLSAGPKGVCLRESGLY